MGFHMLTESKVTITKFRGTYQGQVTNQLFYNQCQGDTRKFELQYFYLFYLYFILLILFYINLFYILFYLFILY